MKLNLRSLEAFRETMLSGSATAAAARMGLTQPAVSRLIAQLEQDARLRTVLPGEGTPQSHARGPDDL